MNHDTLAEAIRAHCQAEILDWYRNVDDLTVARELDALLTKHTDSLIDHLEGVTETVASMMATKLYTEMFGKTCAELLEDEWASPDYNLNAPPEETSAAQDEAGSPHDEADTAAVAAADPAPIEEKYSENYSETPVPSDASDEAAREKGAQASTSQTASVSAELDTTESVLADTPATEGPPPRDPGKQKAEPAGGGAGNGTSNTPKSSSGAAKINTAPRPKTKCASRASQIRARVQDALDGGAPFSAIAERSNVCEQTVRNLEAGGSPQSGTLDKISGGLDRLGY